MEIFLQQIVNGLAIGSIYALVAIGYTMVYGVMKLINFAHGDLVALAAYVGLTVLMQAFGMHITNLWAIILMFVITALFISLFGVVLERLAYRPLRKAPRLSAVVSALGASLAIENGIMLIWGPNIKVFPSNVFPNMRWHISGVVINSTQIAILLLSVILMLALYIFINKTKIGTAIRATAIDQDAAKLMGINVNGIIIAIFALGSFLGSIGGLFIGIYYRELYFQMGWIYGLNAFIAAIIGGIGNIPGAMLGGMLLGIFNVLIAGYVSNGWSEALTFVLLIIILIIKPTGILGERVAEKV